MAKASEEEKRMKELPNYVRRRERRAANTCNWVVRETGVQGMEE